MQCPECGARTEVTETRGPFRDRRCLNAACRFDYTTREHIIPQRESRQCARTRPSNIRDAGGCRPPQEATFGRSPRPPRVFGR